MPDIPLLDEGPLKSPTSLMKYAPGAQKMARIGLGEVVNEARKRGATKYVNVHDVGDNLKDQNIMVACINGCWTALAVGLGVGLATR